MRVGATVDKRRRPVNKHCKKRLGTNTREKAVATDGSVPRDPHYVGQKKELGTQPWRMERKQLAFKKLMRNKKTGMALYRAAYSAPKGGIGKKKAPRRADT